MTAHLARLTFGLADLDLVPRIFATPDGKGHWRVACTHCRRSHVHGGLGHRAPHCVKRGSPYARTGYLLVPRCDEHPQRDVDVVADSAGWMAFQCADGCWLGSVDL